MRQSVALFAVVLAGGCGGDDKVTETVTVTVTETTTPATTTGAATAPPRLPSPLPTDGALRVDAFNDYTESIDEPWERDLAATTDAFVEAGASDATARSFQATTSGEAGATASTTLTLDGLPDDSVRAVRYDLRLSRRDDGTWKIDTARWAQRCHRGRGHQDFTPEPCL